MDHQVDGGRPVRFGLVGAGPWARTVHAPAIVAHPDTELAAVWARRPAAADDLADAHGATVAADPAELFASVDAVAFAVPPDVQAELAGRAAAAGRHLVLEKPVGASVAEAERLAAAVGDAGVASLVLLTSRYAPAVVDWVATAAAGDWSVGTASWVGGALLSGPFSHSPWRHQRGAVLDVGPHVFDLLDAGLGPVVDVVAVTRGGHDVWQVLFAHESGARSSATLSIGLPVDPGVADLTLYGTSGRLSLPTATASSVECYGHLLDELVAMIRTGRTEHPLDVRRGVHLQRLIERVE
ncbi:MAG TPA: Gfo/Idh/MocA family oxidoreductase, partial [Pseudonocardiaceae bacterium]|nr:Gfo/Idh/MocA family oxidoreductase [Pseudonocardiaceae bacterium]